MFSQVLVRDINTSMVRDSTCGHDIMLMGMHALPTTPCMANHLLGEINFSENFYLLQSIGHWRNFSSVKYFHYINSYTKIECNYYV